MSSGRERGGDGSRRAPIPQAPAAAVDRGTLCPECQARAPTTANRCPECSYPLVLEAPKPDEQTVDPRLFVKPGEERGFHEAPVASGTAATARRVPVPARRPPRVASTGPMCPSCHQENPQGRERWCAWCGHDLRPPPHAPTPPPVPPPARRRRRPVVLALAAALAIASGVAAVLLVTSALRRSPDPAPPGAAFRVDNAAVTAHASSTYPSTDQAYDITNTLDGREGTAWNSEGDRVGPGPGVVLTYSFRESVHLRSVTLRNGYVRSARSASSYSDNGRLRLVSLTTDAGTRNWELADSPQAQTLDANLGRTGTLTITVRSVYPGRRFLDLAVTDIWFTATTDGGNS